MRFCERLGVKSPLSTRPKWRYQYHIVFALKYRRQVIYGKLYREIGKILREIFQRNGVEIMEVEVCPHHIHMLVGIPPKMSVSKFMGILIGKSSLKKLLKDNGFKRKANSSLSTEQLIEIVKSKGLKAPG